MPNFIGIVTDYFSDKKDDASLTSSTSTQSEEEVSGDHDLPLGMIQGNKTVTKTMSEIYDMEFPQKQAIVDSLFYYGLYIFAGPPKTGKSLFMLQLAYCVSTGKDMLGFRTTQCDVLYLALEDNYERLRGRMFSMFGTDTTDRLHIMLWSESVKEDVIGQIKEFLVECPETHLVIIDTLGKVRLKGRDSYSYTEDYSFISSFQSFAYSNGLCMILVHHTRKEDSDDVFDKILGTNAIMGASDCSMVITKDVRTDNNSVLHIAGRDQADRKMYLIRDPETLTYSLDKEEKNETKISESPVLKEISELVNEENPLWEGSPTELAYALGLDIAPNSLTRTLNISSNILKEKYSVICSREKTHEGRIIRLKYESDTVA